MNPMIPEKLQFLSDKVEAIYPEAVEWRRHLHRFPEISFEEFETTRWLIDKLGQWGYEIHRPCETGCVAVLEGALPVNPGEPEAIALRADIDALPIQEEGEAKTGFLSQNDGVAHCCGHDLHTSNLLAAARLLSQEKNHIRGRVVLVFQAGEENSPGGASLLMKTGLLQKLGVRQIYGLHVHPLLKPGLITVKEGPLMASPNEFTIEITGKGGHAAAPHLAIDPIVIASQVVVQLQAIVSRYINPLQPAVITVGKLHAGTASNIIPETAFLEGTIRTFDTDMAHRIFERIESISEHTAASAGGTAKARFLTGYPAVINHTETTARLMDLAGSSAIVLDEPIMAGEDFSFYQQEIPGTFFFLGSGSEETDSCHLWHHPLFNVDEQCLKTGIAVMAGLIPGITDIGTP